MSNNIYSVEEIMPNTDYMLFKKGIRPEWEDPNNKDINLKTFSAALRYGKIVCLAKST
jgi:hypothetical protein